MDPTEKVTLELTARLIIASYGLRRGCMLHVDVVEDKLGRWETLEIIWMKMISLNLKKVSRVLPRVVERIMKLKRKSHLVLGEVYDDAQVEEEGEEVGDQVGDYGLQLENAV